MIEGLSSLDPIVDDAKTYLNTYKDLAHHEQIRPILQDGLDWFAKQKIECHGRYISYVFQVKSRRIQQNDPHVALTIHTHGHEIAGLLTGLILADLQKKGRLVLAKGTLTIALNNPAALQRYIDATNNQERTLSRFVDEDMNRLQQDENAVRTTERQRYEELKPLFDQFTHAMDFHTTPYDTPLLVFPHQPMPEVARGLPAAMFENAPLHAVSHIAPALHPETTLSAGYGQGNAQAFTMELGGNTDIASVQRGLVTSLHMFFNRRIISQTTLDNALTYLAQEQIIPRAFAVPGKAIDGIEVYESEHIIRVPKDGKHYYAMEIKPYAEVTPDTPVLSNLDNGEMNILRYKDVGGLKTVHAVMPRLPGAETNVPVIPGSALFYATKPPVHLSIPPRVVSLDLLP